MPHNYPAAQRASVIEYAGRRIVLIDFSRASVAEIGITISAAMPLIRRQPFNSVLTLTDATGIAIADVTTTQLIAFAKSNQPYVKAAAVVGVSSLASAILASVRILSGRSLCTFDSRASALRWLVDQA